MAPPLSIGTSGNIVNAARALNFNPVVA